MNWFKIEVNKGTEGAYHYVGASESTLDELVQKAARGDFVRLDTLLYHDRGDFKPWEEWDASLLPSTTINPKAIITIMQFRGDPRTLRRK
jgi:hypothetical protein